MITRHKLQSQKLLPMTADPPCPTCGSCSPHALSPGAGPYVARLTCHCGQHVRWLSKYQAKQYHIVQQPSSQDWPTTMALAFQAALGDQGAPPVDRAGASRRMHTLLQQRGEQL
jgi:hypothetical protein